MTPRSHHAFLFVCVLFFSLAAHAQTLRCPTGEVELLESAQYGFKSYRPPSYPRLALQAGVQGFVRIDATVNRPNGQVADIKVLSGHPLVLQAATDSVRRMVFDTARLQDEHAVLMFDFYLPCFPRRTPPGQSQPHEIPIVVSKSPCQYTVTQFKDENRSAEPEIKVEIRNSEGKLVRELRPPDGAGRIDEVQAQDLNGDGVPELLVGMSTGGAHCCTVVRILSLDCDITERLFLKGGNADYPKVVTLAGTAEHQLLVEDEDTFAYYPGSFADSPVIPMILCLTNGKYGDCTTRFPAFLLKRLGEVREALFKTEDVQRRGGLAVTILAMYVLLDQRTAGWQDLAHLLNSDEFTWLKSQESMIRTKLLSRAQRMLPSERLRLIRLRGRLRLTTQV